MRNKGFTLIELLVVILIIGLFSSIALVLLRSAKTNAQYTTVQAELNQFIKTVVIAQRESSKTLREMTGQTCTDCGCRGRDIRNISTSDSCYILWESALTKIENATAGSVSGLEKLTRDPWGSPYGLDENEREVSSSDCRYDTIRSAGTNGFLYDDDDQTYDVPFSRPCP